MQKQFDFFPFPAYTPGLLIFFSLSLFMDFGFIFALVVFFGSLGLFFFDRIDKTLVALG
jgi:hypothetical protein